MVIHATGSISLGQNGNSQCRHLFLRLVSGRRVSRGEWIELPITEYVIRKVNTMRNYCKEVSDIVFGLRDGTPMNEIDEEGINVDDYTIDNDPIDPYINIEVVYNNSYGNGHEVINIPQDEDGNSISGVRGNYLIPPEEIYIGNGYNLRPSNSQGFIDY